MKYGTKKGIKVKKAKMRLAWVKSLRIGEIIRIPTLENISSKLAIMNIVMKRNVAIRKCFLLATSANNAFKLTFILDNIRRPSRPTNKNHHAIEPPNINCGNGITNPIAKAGRKRVSWRIPQIAHNFHQLGILVSRFTPSSFSGWWKRGRQRWCLP